MSKHPLTCISVLAMALALCRQAPAQDVKSPTEAAYAALIQVGDKAMAENRAAADAVLPYAKAVGLTDPEREPEVWAMAVTLLADAMTHKGDDVKALELARSVLGLNRRHKIQNAWTIGHAAWTAATILMKAQRWSDAEIYFRWSLAAAEKFGGPDHPGVASVLQALAVSLRNQQKYSEAEALLRRAIGIDGRSRGERHPDLARDLYQLGVVLMEAGLSVDSEELLRHALAIDQANTGPESAEAVRDLDALARCLLHQVESANAYFGNRRRPKADGSGNVTPLMPPLHDILESVRPVYVKRKLAEAENASSRCVQTIVKLRSKALPERTSEKEVLAVYKAILKARRMTPTAIEANVKALTAKADG